MQCGNLVICPVAGESWIFICTKEQQCAMNVGVIIRAWGKIFFSAWLDHWHITCSKPHRNQPHHHCVIRKFHNGVAEEDRQSILSTVLSSGLKNTKCSSVSQVLSYPSPHCSTVAKPWPIFVCTKNNKKHTSYKKSLWKHNYSIFKCHFKWVWWIAYGLPWRPRAGGWAAVHLFTEETHGYSARQFCSFPEESN